MPRNEQQEPTATPPPTNSHLDGDHLELTEPYDTGGAAPSVARWNLSVLTLDVVFFSLSVAFFDPSTVLPQLLERLGATGLMIGLFSSFRSLAFNLPQIFVAYATMNREKQKPFLGKINAVCRLPLLVLPFIIARSEMSEANRHIALAATIGLLFFWSLGDGLGYVPWMEIVARSFSNRTRGRFFATTQSLSGTISIGIAALGVAPILYSKTLGYPANYALLVLLYALLMQVSLAGVLLIKEPPVPDSFHERAKEPHPSLKEYLQQLPTLFRTNIVFRKLCTVALLVNFGLASQPFYVLYAKRYFHLGDEWGGKFQVYLALGAVTLLPLWAFISERKGAHNSIRFAAFGCLLTPIVALTIGRVSPWLYGLVFLLMGGTLGWGFWIVLNHYLLLHIDEKQRQVFLALINLVLAPSSFYSALGGFFIHNGEFASIQGFPVLFLLTALVVGAGVYQTRYLPNPSQNETST